MLRADPVVFEGDEVGAFLVEMDAPNPGQAVRVEMARAAFRSVYSPEPANRLFDDEAPAQSARASKVLRLGP